MVPMSHNERLVAEKARMINNHVERQNPVPDSNCRQIYLRLRSHHTVLQHKHKPKRKSKRMPKQQQ